MKRHSLIQNTFVLLFILVLLVTAVFAVYCVLTYDSSRREAIAAADSMLRVYCAQIDGELKRADTVLQNVVLDRADELDLLQSPQERERYFAGVEIHNTLLSALQANSGINMIAVCDGEYNAWYDACPERSLSLPEKSALELFARGLLSQGQRAFDWEAAVLDGQAYLYRYYTRDGHLAIVFLRADSLLSMDPAGEGMPVTWLLKNGEETVLASKNTAPGAETEGGEPKAAELRGQIVRSAALAENGFTLTAVVSRTAMLRQLRLSLLVMGLLSAALVVFSLLLLRYGRASVVQPLRRMTGQLQSMKDGAADLYLEGECDTEEFSILQDSFNRLMTDNVNLRLKSYQTRLETQGTELRCIRLQLRPHFFLNALTTISSLSMQGKNEEIKAYINALSRNIRYMFKSGLHTVPLREELSAVKNYFDMQELKYPGTVFFMLQQEPGTEEWPVPQMIIHTVLENEYKHAITIGETLTILTDITTVETGGETFLSIAIEDDGKGYPPEVLNAEALRQDSGGSRVGLSSIARMLAIMYGREGLLQLSNVEPHGAKTRILIPAAPANEYRETSDVG